MTKLSFGLLAALLIGSAFEAAAQPRAGDEFHGNSSEGRAPGASDPAQCGDPRIAEIERRTGTVARVFDLRASGTKSGLLGGQLENKGLVKTTGVCAGKGNAMVMFIGRDKIAAVDKATNDYFGSRYRTPAMSATPNGASPRGSGGRTDTNPELDALRRQDDAALVGLCGRILEQTGNFRNSISCKSRRVVDFCDQFQASDPKCPAIIAKLKQEVPNLDGLSYDGSRPISRCQHNPKSPGCKGIVLERDPNVVKKSETRPKPAPTPHPPASRTLATLEGCLSRDLSYYQPRDYGSSGNVTVPGSHGSTSRARVDRAFRLETAVAREVQQQHDRKFGVRVNDDDPRFRIDRIVGYLHRCLKDAGLIPYTKNNSPDDPRVLYGKFVGSDIKSARVREFSSGYREPWWVPDSLESGR